MFEWIGDRIGKIIWNNLLMWLYETIYQAAADFFAMMGNMGAEIFDLSWVAAVVQLFSLFGWALFGTGMVTAVFDVTAMDTQNGRGNLNMTALNVLKGFFAASLVDVLPGLSFHFPSRCKTHYRGTSWNFYRGRKRRFFRKSRADAIGKLPD